MSARKKILLELLKMGVSELSKNLLNKKKKRNDLEPSSGFMKELENEDPASFMNIIRLPPCKFE